MERKPVVFEVSWEVGNMLGGIHTLLATKAREMQNYYGDDYVVVGPDFTHLEGRPSAALREESWDTAIPEDLRALNISCRMGRWLVPGEPRCLLVNFADLYPHKNKLLGLYWDWYQLDSLTGGWDYMEPLLFGHAVGTVLEQIAYRQLLPDGRAMTVQAHGWMSGAALLYLRKMVPEAGTVFTAHGTVLGRALAAEQDGPRPDSDPYDLAQKYKVLAKHSLESISAHTADFFTAVSPLCAEEAVRYFGKSPDGILPNGLSDDFAVVDSSPEQDGVRETARERLFTLAEKVTGASYDRRNTHTVLTSGRYEHINKGFDVFIDALARLQDGFRGSDTRLLAFIMVPAPNHGAETAVSGREPSESGHLSTHSLRDEAGDPILKQLRARNLLNQADSPLHVIFVPIYLDGTDDIIEATYPQLLPGVDLTAFPSLYEPWGYAPMESLACGVPTITSDRSGLGRWLVENGNDENDALRILPRWDTSQEEASHRLAALIKDFVDMSPEQKDAARLAALRVSGHLRWTECGGHYRKAHRVAYEKAKPRAYLSSPDRFKAFARTQVVSTSQNGFVRAHMREFLVLNQLPPELEPLRELAMNTWWSWQRNTEALFAELDPDLWQRVERNPRMFLEHISSARTRKAIESREYMQRLEEAVTRFREQLRAKPPARIGFFSAEFGITNYLRIYSGGLGILAGDFLKAAADRQTGLCGIGLAYHLGYFRQSIRGDGSQESIYEPTDFLSSTLEPVTHNHRPVTVEVPFPTGQIYARAWKAAVGAIDLYLLDTDFGMNRPADRQITNSLYGGDQNQRLRQEFILGIGGYQLLKALDQLPDVYHMNEGHSAFLVLARLVDLMHKESLSFEEALTYVRRTSIFTTHTPVAAGHDVFPEDLIRPFLLPYEKALKQDWSRLLALGQPPEAPSPFTFSTTLLALHGSARVNGVSSIHGHISREMFREEFPGSHTDEVPITSITNGVHVPTWLAPEWQDLFSEQLGVDWRERLSDREYWSRVSTLDPETVWNHHRRLKQKLFDWLHEHIHDTWTRRRESPGLITDVLAKLDPESLVVGFARRFATYKRAALLFHDLDRFRKMLRSTERPIVFLFAGKAHPADGPGQALIKEIVELSRDPEFRGHILFIENYEIDVAKHLIAGCDVWLNNPVPPMEASGTSGMKAAMNGCLNLSIADGWWPEAYNGRNGWMLSGRECMVLSPDYRDAYDSSRLYALFEQEVLPLFFTRDEAGLPQGWLEFMKESMASIIPRFSMRRMLDEYTERFYEPALWEAGELAKNRFEKLRGLTAIEERIRRNWDSVSFAAVQVAGLDGEAVTTGEKISVHVNLQHPRLNTDSLQPQVVLARVASQEQLTEMKTVNLEQRQDDGGTSTWEGEVVCTEPGAWSLGVRVLPRHTYEGGSDYPHLMKWL